jgi:penicillin-binding protein 1A
MNDKAPRHKRIGHSGRRRYWLLASVWALGFVVLAGLSAGIWLYRLSLDLPDVSRLETYRPSQTTEIFSSDGVLLARLFDQNRDVVPLRDIPTNLRNATIAVEDHRFFEHRGVDWRGVARALVTNLEDSRYAQGGSTITQQLVRNLYLSPDKRLRRKIREAMLAIRVERRFNKNEILEMYLNQVFYGARSFGVEAAARTYFGKPAKELSLVQCALLAGIPQRPGLYDPYANPTESRQRRNVVLKRMADTGYISASQAHAAMNAPIGLAYHHQPRLTARRAPYFVDYVIRLLEDRYGAEQVYRGGMRVQTTLNTRAQSAAEDALKNGMNARFGRRPTVSALLSIDPVSGYIRAMVGGRDYKTSVFNRAVQAHRQPGSAFKPFVYAAALNAGMTPRDRITDGPVTFEESHWTPHNYDHRWHGRVTLTEALADSINIPAIKLLDTVGTTSAIQMARACGITSDLSDNLTLALGTSEVTMLEITSAYGTFAAGGYHTDPLAIVNVKDSQGRVLEQHYPDPESVLDEVVARRIDFMLRQVVRVGTGRPAAGIPNARGKTGTTDDLHDAWFIGYTPDLVTAVWVGNDKPRRIPGLTGGGECAPIWTAYMRRALAILPRHPIPAALKVAPPKPAANIHVAEAPTSKDARLATDAGTRIVHRRICVMSGQLATRYCPETSMEAFAASDAPTQYCIVHHAPAATEGNATDTTAPPPPGAP